MIAFLERLRGFTVLDPACGSGNFLFLALRSLKDIEHRVLVEAETMGLGRQFPALGPANVKGIELNAYAAELARITIWIGEIQWMIQNGYGANRNPILQPLNQIENRDAILGEDGKEAKWPAASAIIGNPPFIGGNKMRRELGDDYAERVRKVFNRRVAGSADFVCFFFEKARAEVEAERAETCGLVATNSIRGGANRKVLSRIKDGLEIFEAWSDEPWVNEGAAVRVSLVMFRPDDTPAGRLDGRDVPEITSSLTELVDHDEATAPRLATNRGRAFQGSVKVGKFDITGATARDWLVQPNATGLSNAEVLRPLWNAKDITARPRGVWIIDFGDRTETNAAGYEKPFEQVKAKVKPKRATNKDKNRRERWWQHGRVGTDIRAASAGLARVIVSPRVAKFRAFVWAHPRTYCDDATVTIASADDTIFGILHSRMHEVWALRMGTELGVGNDPRYTPTTCFETFAFPDGLTPDRAPADYAGDARAIAIADAARALVEARDRWLNPPEWTERVPEVVAGYPDRIIAKAGHEASLKKRTMTKLYNERPTWLDNLHKTLDEAVAKAYGWPWPMGDDEILRSLFELNQTRATPAD